ncbi:helix-turn-helix XRE-family transcriptional regulators [Candidatus Termititenax persephonae]|uniref:Helix-turn-helix XRE-family transcriptional regulators n=1 Tax=Candidatus Termititenax persephonae TaxID=2218525 RepID=A0A388TGU3_9BACT|nr:helix-turn-helix XRE-family transcriptional regulators [Candidatus Termititenax persephonae]
MEKELEQELKKLISSKLQQIRKAKNYTIEKFADTLSLDYAVVHNIISGVRLPRLTTLWHISKTLDISLDSWFKDLSFENKVISDKKSIDFAMLYNFKKLDKTNKAFIVRVLQGLNAKVRKYRLNK